LDDKPDDGSPISHGICGGCAEQALTSRTSINAFLNRLEFPVLAVDGNVRVISANTPALLALKKERTEIEHRLGGEVIECIYSAQSGGCGKTLHCTGCQIRMSVNRTNTTGEPLTQVKAYQHIMTPLGAKQIDYYISTEKLGDGTVLLRIDDVRARESTADEDRKGLS
jgi:hypothetical protein